MTMKDIITLLRPAQWIKNLFVLAPLFFSNNILKQDLLLQAVIAFVAFCLAASSIYCLNDIFDRKTDSLHPKKKHRPVASGKISVNKAYLIMAFCLVAALGFAAITNVFCVVGILIYCIINILYCLRLKRHAIIDVFIISFGYVIRVLVGGAVTDIQVSGWLVLMTFLLTLFLAFAKRKDDYYIYEETGQIQRQSIKGYNAQFIDLSVALTGTITIVCYIIYTMSDSVIARMGSQYLYLTSFWVVAGILRHMQNMLVFQRSGSPTKAVLHDRFIQICILGWGASFVAIIYL